MSQEVDRSLTLDEMMEAIRQEVRQRRAAQRPAHSLQGDLLSMRWSAGQPVNSADWDRIGQNLGVAEQFAPISSLQPQFVEWGKYRRTVARGVARGVMYVSQFITNKQARFNESLLAAVRDLAAHVRGLLDREAELAGSARDARGPALEARLRDLEATVNLKLASLEARLARLEATHRDP